MTLTVDTLIEALENNDIRMLSPGARVDYGFMGMDKKSVKLMGRTVYADEVLLAVYRTIYHSKVRDSPQIMQKWKKDLHKACIKGTVHEYIEEWYANNSATDVMWLVFTGQGWKIENPYPFDDEDY